MKTDKISFGTNSYITEQALRNELRKYPPRLSQGLYDFFEILEKDGKNDSLIIDLGYKTNKDGKNINAIKISLNTTKTMFLNLHLLEKLSTKKITQKLLKSINNLQNTELTTNNERLASFNENFLRQISGKKPLPEKSLTAKQRKILEKLIPFVLPSSGGI